MLRKQLPSGKFVAFEKKAGSHDFSVALQIPIKHEKAIAELKKRMLFFASKNKELGDVLESPGNFHITLQMFFPNVDQIDKVKDILESLLAKQSENIPIEMTDKNAIFGDEKKNACYPVALIESKKLVELQLQFQDALAKAGIKYNNKFKFNPHVSLFVVGSRLNPDTLEGITNTAVQVDTTFELSHKNDVNQFVALTVQDLNFLSAEFKSKQPEKNTRTQTKQDFIDDFCSLTQNSEQPILEWRNLIKNNFLDSEVGLYCIQNNISAADAITSLQTMKVKDHFELKTGKGKIWGDKLTWFAVKNVDALLTEFKSHLPHALTPPSPKHATQQPPAPVIVIPPPKPPVAKPAPTPPELKFKLHNSIYKEDINLHKAKNKQTMQEFLTDFAKLANGDAQLTNEWYYMIKTRFVECEIGLYCINNNISAKDTIAALQKLDFKAHCEIKTTLYKLNKAVSEYQTWPAIKNPTGLLEEFIKNLPNPTLGPRAGIIQRP